MKEKFAFLSSVRFWKLVIVAVLGALAQYGVVSVEIVSMIQTLLVGDVALNTIDRF